MEQVDAKEKLGAQDASTLIENVQEIIVAKGKKTLRYTKEDWLSNPDLLLEQMLGRTGNLRAPTFIQDNVLVVGFHQALYERFFGIESSSSK